MKAGERAILVTCALYLIVVGHGLLVQLIPPVWAVWSAVALIVVVAATAAVFLRIASRRDQRPWWHGVDAADAMAEGLASNNAKARDAIARMAASIALTDPDATGPIPTVQAVDLDLDAARPRHSRLEDPDDHH